MEGSKQTGKFQPTSSFPNDRSHTKCLVFLDVGMPSIKQASAVTLVFSNLDQVYESHPGTYPFPAIDKKSGRRHS